MADETRLEHWREQPIPKPESIRAVGLKIMMHGYMEVARGMREAGHDVDFDFAAARRLAETELRAAEREGNRREFFGWLGGEIPASHGSPDPEPAGVLHDRDNPDPPAVQG